MQSLYTIGYSTHEIDYFIELLKTHKIDSIVDVRSSPYSGRNPEFNKSDLKLTLKNNNIHYIFMGPELGARRIEGRLYSDGIVDFEKVRKDATFLKGIKRVTDGLDKGHRIALMCSEKKPIECHRTILVSRQFSINHVEVKHILADGSIISHNEIDDELIFKYFDNYNQLSLFGEFNSKDDYLKESYRKQNRIVGYKIDEGDEDAE